MSDDVEGIPLDHDLFEEKKIQVVIEPLPASSLLLAHRPESIQKLVMKHTMILMEEIGKRKLVPISEIMRFQRQSGAQELEVHCIDLGPEVASTYAKINMIRVQYLSLPYGSADVVYWPKTQTEVNS